MASKLNSSFLFIACVIMTLVFVFAKCNHKTNPAINAYVVEQADGWQKVKQQSIDTSSGFKLKLQFLNNPYKFDKKHDVAIYINQSLVFKGSFESLVDLYLPNKFFDDRVLPGLTVYDGKKAYNFIHKTSMFLNKDDRFLYIVFCPENELMESCYMFAQKEPIL